jgi:hypothetical protein
VNNLKDLQNAIKELQQLKDNNVIPFFADGMLKAYCDLLPLVKKLNSSVFVKQRSLLIDFCNKAEDNAKGYQHLIPSDDFIEKYLKDKY